MRRRVLLPAPRLAPLRARSQALLPALLRARAPRGPKGRDRGSPGLEVSRVGAPRHRLSLRVLLLSALGT